MNSEQPPSNNRTMWRGFMIAFACAGFLVLAILVLYWVMIQGIPPVLPFSREKLDALKPGMKMEEVIRTLGEEPQHKYTGKTRRNIIYYADHKKSQSGVQLWFTLDDRYIEWNVTDDLLLDKE